MAVTVTNTTVSAFDTIQTFTANAATSTVVDGTEVFTITPTKAGIKGLIMMSNANSHGTYTYSIAAGDCWAGKAITGSMAQNTTKILQIETGKVLQDDGTIAVTLTPASTKILLTNHAAVVYYAELL